MLAPLIGALVVSLSGWQAAFYVTGAIGLVWVVFWLMSYRSPAEHPRVSSERTRLYQPGSGSRGAEGSLGQVADLSRHLGLHRRRACSPIRPGGSTTTGYRASSTRKFHVSLFAVGLPLVVIYLLTDVGSIAGGWVSSTLIKRGMDVFPARKITLLICAACTLPVFLAPQLDSMWTAVILIGIAMAAHQGFSANLFTLVSDTMPRGAVASAVGLGGGISSVAGAFSAAVVGRVLDATGNNYTVVFFACASVYVIATVIIHFILPRSRASMVTVPAETVAL